VFGSFEETFEGVLLVARLSAALRNECMYVYAEITVSCFPSLQNPTRDAFSFTLYRLRSTELEYNLRFPNSNVSFQAA
jgi:hypothetical protein